MNLRVHPALLLAIASLVVVTGCSDEPDGSDSKDVLDPSVDGIAGDTDTADTGILGDVDCSMDDDEDGLGNCEEAKLCTDPSAADTDQDDLTDLEELELETDPCKADTDGDGVDDGKERRLGYDPKKKDTDGDGTPDGDEWWANACRETSPEPVEYHSSFAGNWTLALPPAIGNYTDLSIADARRPVAAAVYGDTANEIAGFLLSKKLPMGQSSPTDALQNEAKKALQNLGSVTKDQIGGEYEMHDGHTAATARFLLKLSKKRSTRDLRQNVLLGLAPFKKSDVQQLPATVGATYQKFRVFVSVIHRTGDDATDQSLTSVALAPADWFDMHDRVKFRMDNWTNTTAISAYDVGHRDRCVRWRRRDTRPKLEVYWVVDQTGPTGYAKKIRDLASEFHNQLSNTSLRYRFGVTNMHPKNEGHVANPPGWHQNEAAFLKALENRVLNCQTSDGWHCSGADPHGLEAAKKGLDYMLGRGNASPGSDEAVRSDAEVVTILISDEKDASLGGGGMNLAQYQADLGRKTTIFALSAGSDCAQSPTNDTYRKMAVATGGKHLDLCDDNLERLLRDIIFRASGFVEHFVLPSTPISPSLRLHADDDWVPRSRSDGFDYLAENNGLSFFGKYRLGNLNPDGVTEFVLRYETFESSN